MKEKGPYAIEPHVPAGKVAGTNPMGRVSVGDNAHTTPGLVPKTTGHTTGLVPGRSRDSGHPRAHRIGKR